MKENGYGLEIELARAHGDAVALVSEALKKEGFGVITKIDMRGTLKEKLGADFRNYTILGACNPAFAKQALDVELAIGLLLPCNFAVFDNENGVSTVMALDPAALLKIVDKPAISEIAAEMKARVGKVMKSLEDPA